MGNKLKNLFRHQSSNPTEVPTASTHPNLNEAVLDQNASGAQMPSASANAMGATNVNANAEIGWPGMIDGEKLGAVVVGLQGIEKGRVTLGGGKKGEGSWVIVPVGPGEEFSFSPS